MKKTIILITLLALSANAEYVLSPEGEYIYSPSGQVYINPEGEYQGVPNTTITPEGEFVPDYDQWYSDQEESAD